MFKLKYCFLFICLFCSVSFFKAQAQDLNDKLIAGIESGGKFFIENKGQIASMETNAPVPSVLFYSAGKSSNLYLRNDGISYVFYKIVLPAENENDPYSSLNTSYTGEWERVDMQLVDCNKNPKIEKSESSNYFENYFLAQCPQGITKLKSHKKITYKNIYPNIDWVIYYNESDNLKYDFIVHPGGNPNDIKIKYNWADKPVLNSDGSILINGPLGNITENAPIVTQGSKEINSEWQIQSNNILKIKTDNYNTSIDLIIDPILFWGTYYGGAGADLGYSIKSDGTSVFVTGTITSTNFPTLNPGGTSYFQGTYSGGTGNDIFIIKFNNLGVREWATYYGGTSEEGRETITLNSNSIYLTGQTQSIDFPTLNPGGGTYYQATNGFLVNTGDAFILQFDKSGNRIWSTYFGGNFWETGYSAYCNDNFLYLALLSSSTNMPIYNPGGGAFIQNTIAGINDNYLIKFTSSGVPIWGTYFGGTDDEEIFPSIAEFNGSIYVSGATKSTNFPLANPGGTAYYQPINAGLKDITISRFSTDGVLNWSTYLGGTSDETVRSMGVNNNNIWIGGFSSSTNIPTANPGNGAYFQPANAGGLDGFIASFNDLNEYTWGTYYGGSAQDYLTSIHADSKSIWATGRTVSTNLPLLNPGMGSFFQGTKGLSSDAFILKFKQSGIRQWATYYGANNGDEPYSIFSDNSYVWVTGISTSTDLTTLDPGNSAYYSASTTGGNDIFILKFDVCIKPDVTINNVTPSICYGDTMILVGNGAESYLWSPLNILNDTLSFTPPLTFNYIVTGTDDMNCSNIANATVIVNSKPVLQISAPDSTCFGTPYTLNVISNLPSTYLWNPGNGLDSNFTVNPDTVSHTFYYSVIVTDTLNGCKDTATTSIYVNALPQLIISAPDSTCYGTPYTLHVTSNLPSTYQWSPGTGIDSTFTVNPDTAGNTFSYSVIVTDTINGCRDTANTTIFVNWKPDIYITGAGSFCPDTTINIQVHDIYHLPLTYDWHPTNTPDSILTFVLNTPDSIYFDTVYVQTPFGCRDTAYTTFVAWPIPTVNITPNDTAICYGQPININITSNMPSNLFWTIPDSIMNSSATLFPDSVGYTYNYIAHAIDSIHGCKNLDSVSVLIYEKPVLSLASLYLMCPYETITLTASSSMPVSYLWDPSNNTDSFIVFHPNTADTTYSYTLYGTTTNNCKDTANTFVVVYPSINVSIAPIDTALCLLDSITIFGFGGNTYEWSIDTNFVASTSQITISPSINTTYTLIGTSTELCKDTTSTFITVYSLPKFNVLGNNHICKGNSTLFQVDSTFDNTITYLWQPGNLNGDSVVLSPQDTTTYTVIGTDTNTCHFTVNFQIDVDTLPIAKITGISPICYGGSVDLQASGGTSFLWQPGNFTTPVNTVTPNSAGNFTYTLIANSTICYDTTTFQLTVNPKPVLTLTHDTTLIIGQYVPLHVTGAQFYDWSPTNDLSCFDCPDLIAKPYSTIEYCVIGTNAFDCSDTACINITVDTECGEVFVPSGFSPNGDGNNDILYVYGKCVKSMEFKIFNRWGEKVFETTDPSIGWDGIYKGKTADTDVFVYYLKAEYFIGSKVDTKGNITLMR